MFDTKRVFISGPMTGIEDFNRPAFMDAEEKLKSAGFSVFNPAWLRFDSGFDNAAIMAVDLAALSHCNYIYQLEGWEKSKGASAEWSFALSSGIKFINHDWLNWFCIRRKKYDEEEKSVNKSSRSQDRQECSEGCYEEAGCSQA